MPTPMLPRAPTVLLLAAALLVVATTHAPAEARRKGPEARASAAFVLARAGEAARVEAVLPDPARARPSRRAVSDILLILGSDDGNVDNALGLMNGVPGTARLFRARIAAVLGGRIHSQTAVCGGWQQDVSTCRVACDGGVFALSRKPGAEATYALVLGKGAAGEMIEEARTGVLVSPCDRDNGPEVRLVPAGGAETTTLTLAGE